MIKETQNHYTVTQEIIVHLIQNIADIRKIWSNIRRDNPSFEQVSIENWRGREADCWLYGATSLRR